MPSRTRRPTGAILLAVTLAGLLAQTASAARKLYIPPVFSNKDWACTTNAMNSVPNCYDFSLTNLSSIPQNVRVTWRSGSKMFGAFQGIGFSAQLPSDMNTDLFFDGTEGQNRQLYFCFLCTTSGTCNFGPNLVSAGGAPFDGAGIPPPPAVPQWPTVPAGSEVNWFYFHANVSFVITVTEDRGALLGRMTERIFPGGGTNLPTCRDQYTSPPMIVELNGGRPF
jgi:hypothetical protein